MRSDRTEPPDNPDDLELENSPDNFLYLLDSDNDDSPASRNSQLDSFQLESLQNSDELVFSQAKDLLPSQEVEPSNSSEDSEDTSNLHVTSQEPGFSLGSETGQDHGSSFPFTHPDQNLAEYLEDIVGAMGVAESARAILDNKDLKEEIMRQLMLESHETFKKSLKSSQLCAEKKHRNYLLSLTPKLLCEEFRKNSSPAFHLLVTGLLGITDSSVVFENQYLLNNIVFIYSTISKVINRKATGYALLLTNAVRDGGLREDSIKIFSMLVHPRTSQKYDREVLAKDWNKPLEMTMQAEREHFKNIHEALQAKAEMIEDESSTAEEINQIDKKISELIGSVPPQVQKVWDNINLHIKHRFKREKGTFK